MFIVGLTGGIASGKSTVSDEFKRLGVAIVDADLIAREVVTPGRNAWQTIRKEFGDSILNEDGTIDRSKLGEIVFNDETKRKRLNQITHPDIRREMVKKLFFAMCRGHRFAIVDVPLLFESCPRKLIKFFSYIVVVDCPAPLQLERLMSRNEFTRREANSRLRSQMALQDKCQMATHVVDNSGTRENTYKQVSELYDEFCSSRRYWKVRILVLSMMSLWLASMVQVGKFIFGDVIFAGWW